MKLDPPLSNLVARCQTICAAECCGLSAYDFSPIQIASYLTMMRGVADKKEVRAIEDQLSSLSANYGVHGAGGQGVTIEEMNQVFSGSDLDCWVAEIRANLTVALTLAAESEARRFKKEPNQSPEPMPLKRHGSP